MRIGVDARVILKYPGLGRYCLNILRGLADIDKKNSYTVFSLSPISLGHDDRVAVRVVSYPVLSFKTFYAFSRTVNEYGFDLFFAPFQIAPLALNCPMVTVIHDMMDLLYADAFSHHPLPVRLGLKAFFRYAIPRTVSRSRTLIAVSESTRKQVLDYFPVRPDKVVTVLEGVEASFTAGCSPEVLMSVRKKYNLPGRFILYLGSIKPYKNLAGVIEAFALLRGKHGIKDVDLIIAGLKHYGADDIQKKVIKHGLQSSVRRIGFVEEADLPAVYRLADVFFFPSLWEGFGLPALEAMACGTPVITSNTSSMPEVVGEAGMQVDPRDHQGMADGLMRVLADETLRKSMSVQGLERAKRFSWNKAAEETLSVLERAHEAAGGK